MREKAVICWQSLPAKYKVWQEVMEQLVKVIQPDISLSVPVDGYLSLYDTRTGKKL